jgi:hypothetical protein
VLLAALDGAQGSAMGRNLCVGVSKRFGVACPDGVFKGFVPEKLNLLSDVHGSNSLSDEERLPRYRLKSRNIRRRKFLRSLPFENLQEEWSARQDSNLQPRE